MYKIEISWRNIVINRTASTMDILLRIYYMEVYVF